MDIKRSTPMVSTKNLDAVKKFYTEHLGFRATFEGKGYLGLRAPEPSTTEVHFMEPCDDMREHKVGLTLSLLVEDPDAEHDRLKKRDVPIVRPLQDNPWGDRSFVVVDPAGVGLYFYKEIPMAEEFRKYVKE